MIIRKNNQENKQKEKKKKPKNLKIQKGYVLTLQLYFLMEPNVEY